MKRWDWEQPIATDIAMALRRRAACGDARAVEAPLIGRTRLNDVAAPVDHVVQIAAAPAVVRRRVADDIAKLRRIAERPAIVGAAVIVVARRRAARRDEDRRDRMKPSPHP